MGWVLFVIVVVVAIGFWGNNHLNKVEEERNQGRALKEAQYASDRAAFIETEVGDAEIHPVKMEGRAAMLISPSDTDLRIIQHSEFTDWIGNEWRVYLDRTIALADLRSVAFEQDDVVENYVQKVVTPVAVTKNKSVVGRGLVGAAVLGPVGLALGAASAVKSTTKVIEHTTTQAAQRTVKGPPTLVLTTRDRTNPFVRIEFAKADDAKAWALWLGEQLDERA